MKCNSLLLAHIHTPILHSAAFNFYGIVPMVQVIVLLGLNLRKNDRKLTCDIVIMTGFDLNV